MKRDKSISIRVNSDLLEQVNKIISESTEVHEFYTHRWYSCSLNGYHSGKFTIADFFEKAMKEFIEKHKQHNV